MSGKYHGSWGSWEDMRNSWMESGRWNYDRGEYDPVPPIDGFPTDDEVVFAAYGEEESYSGAGFVVFERDGKVFENHGSHCSCNGLEGLWSPTETTWKALAAWSPRPENESYGDYSAETAAAWKAVAAAKVAK